ncbi:MAG: group III truncated hemoglobin [Saprospiraceae bacterium]
MTKSDIQNRSDIQKIIDAFYDKVKIDESVGHMFADVNWEAHLPVMVDFWENVVFYTGGYSGNPMAKHQKLNQTQPLKPEHFQRWLALFNLTIDESYEGENASLLKERAKSIATIMEMKIIQ